MRMLMILTSGTMENIDIKALLICIGIGILIGLVTVLIMRSQLKSVRPKNAAADYVVRGSFQLRHSRDIFLYRHVHRTPKPKNNNK